mmetsp:Transcript_399/g.621  ORF Transcript_399/g.621 Transcript_399/m.621 type:complete len:906 (-) Transcript_399:371-3088(-)
MHNRNAALIAFLWITAALGNTDKTSYSTTKTRGGASVLGHYRTSGASSSTESGTNLADGADPYGFSTPSDLEEMLQESILEDLASAAGRNNIVRSSEEEDSDEDDEQDSDLRNAKLNLADSDKEYENDSEKDALYEAYNLLHTLAQDFEKPFDSPAVLVVGHQSSGKSALIEALMGFQFNQVGGGTKTRRPIALRMQYNPRCTTPRCYLHCEDGVERAKSMPEIQQYIESENARLERDPMRCFDAREINIRMEYKYCPNMILIDTPGLINAPKLQKSMPQNTQQRALWASAREAEKLVISKMQCQDYIILCVEDTSDWKHGQTRQVVQKADPDLSRTVIVNTKLDTKVPQFGTPSDVQEFLRAGILKQLSPHSLGGPYFTSVPSGRVGVGQVYLFDSNDEFVHACAENEDSDRAVISQRLKLANSAESESMHDLMPRVGLSKLRGFLERKVDECYRRNVAKILPLLRTEHHATSKKLAKVQEELDSLSPERMKAGADAFCDEFCKALKEAVHGSIKAPASIFGENLQQEHCATGSFHEIASSPLAVNTQTFASLLESEVGNTQHKLYGGAQYHRLLREFDLASKCMRLPTITEDEIANAAGVGETHDGVNFLRAACVISVFKAQASFEPFLEMLRDRCCHVMTKLLPICEHMIRNKHSSECSSFYSGGNDLSRNDRNVDITQIPQFRQVISSIFDQFVHKVSDSVMRRCRDDLNALTRFVTWDLRERSSGALRRSLPDSTDIVQVYQVAIASNSGEQKGEGVKPQTNKQISERVNMPIDADRDYQNLLQLMEEAACARDANRTNMVVGGLVQHIVAQWRESFGKQVVTKFNCFFLLPFVDEFQRYLRFELQKMYEGDMTEVFDMTAARSQLQRHRDELLNELEANERLQEKFEMVSRMMRKQASS